VNIEIQDVSDTRKNLVVTLDPSEVATEHRAIVAEYAKQARLPGFRPGKAPAGMVEKRFAKEIVEEFKSKVVGKAYRDGLAQSKLEVQSLVEVKEGVIEAGISAAVTFTVDLRPQFELPQYKGLQTTSVSTEPTDAEVEAGIQSMRAERADFKPVERAAQKGDYLKLSYEGRIGEQPVAELVPDRKIFGQAPQTWEEVDGVEGLIPGLGTHLAGLEKGAKKEVPIHFAANFHVTELAGKDALYAVEVLEVRERVLPELDETFFKAHQVDSLAALQAQTRENLKYQKEHENRAGQRRQVSEALASAVEFAVPESLVESETQQLLRRFIEDNMRRGVPQEAFEKNKNQLYEDARKAATRNARTQLILGRIAEAEKLEVKDVDIDRFLRIEAMRAGQKPDKFAKDLGKDQNRIRAMHQTIVLDKALDFVVAQATVVAAPAQA
jgi:trigger factor